MEQTQQDQSMDEKASAQWRIKEGQIFTITRRFREVMNKYNLESVSHRDRCKRAIMRELDLSKSIHHSLKHQMIIISLDLL